MLKRRRIGYKVPFSDYGERHVRRAASGNLYYVYGQQKKAVPGCRCIVCEQKRKAGEENAKQ